jgi:hypothetical protein
MVVFIALCLESHDSKSRVAAVRDILKHIGHIHHSAAAAHDPWLLHESGDDAYRDCVSRGTGTRPVLKRSQ